MNYALHLLTILLFYYCLSCSQAILTLHLRLLAVSQAAVAAVGAYGAAIIATRYGVPFPVSLLMSMLAASIFLLPLYFLRTLNEEMVVLATVALQIATIELLLNLTNFTGGAFGIAGVAMGWPVELLGRKEGVLVAFLVLAVVCGVILNWLRVSQFGVKLRVVGDDRVFAASLGIDVGTVRLLGFLMSIFIAGTAGGIYAHYITFIEPLGFSITESILIVSIVIIAGSAKPFRLFVATFVVAIAPELLREFRIFGDSNANLRQMVFGVLLVFSVLTNGGLRTKLV